MTLLTTIAIIVACTQPPSVETAKEHDSSKVSDGSAPVRSCGRESLSLLLRVIEAEIKEEELDEILGDCDASNLAELQNAAEQLGLKTRAVRWKHRALPDELDLPAILLLGGPNVTGIDDGNFVLVARNKKGGWQLIEFPWFSGVIAPDRLAKNWDGTALYVVKDAAELDVVDRLIRVSLLRVRILAFTGVAVFLCVAITGAYVFRNHRCRSMGMKPIAPAFDLTALWRRHRRGVSLIELLVSIGIIAILLSMVLPAVQSTRESARRIQCLQNLRQFGIAIHQYEEMHAWLPPGFIQWLKPVGFGERWFWFSPHSMLLPSLGQSDLHNAVNFSVAAGPDAHDPANYTAARSRVPLFLCPSDESPRGALPGNNYRFNAGPGPYASPGLFGGDAGAFPYRLIVRSRDFTDGLHATVAMSEKTRGSLGRGFSPWRDVMLLLRDDSPPDFPTTDEWVAHCRTMPLGAKFRMDSGGEWLMGETLFTNYNHTQTPNSEIVDCGRYGLTPHVGLFPARSLHPGGVNVLLMDGSVRFVSNSVDLALWRALSTRAGGEQISDAAW